MRGLFNKRHQLLFKLVFEFAKDYPFLFALTYLVLEQYQQLMIKFLVDLVLKGGNILPDTSIPQTGNRPIMKGLYFEIPVVVSLTRDSAVGRVY